MELFIKNPLVSARYKSQQRASLHSPVLKSLVIQMWPSKIYITIPH